MLQKPDKKSLIYLAIVLVAFFLAIFLIYYYSKVPKIKEEPSKIQVPTEDETIKKQLEELEKLKGETKPLTEKEIQSQLKELEKLRKKTKSLSQEEIQKQLEELKNLRE